MSVTCRMFITELNIQTVRVFAMLRKFSRDWLASAVLGLNSHFLSPTFFSLIQRIVFLPRSLLPVSRIPQRLHLVTKVRSRRNVTWYGISEF